VGAGAAIVALGAELLLGQASAGDSGASGEQAELLGAVGGDLVVFEPMRPQRPTPITMGTRVAAEAARLLAVLQDPRAYQRAIPAFSEAEIVQEAKREPSRVGPADRLIAWELEIPLWNLKGRLWLRPQERGVRLDLVAGDLLPGSFTLQALPDGERSILWLTGSANIKDANFMTRRLARRHALTEPAMTATAAYVLLRGLALEAERAVDEGAAGPRRPHAAMSAPPIAELDGAAFGALAVARFPPHVVVAKIHARPDGRLHHVAAAVRAARPVARLRDLLAQPAAWRALPGWKRIEVLPGPVGAPSLRRWRVDSSLPLVDFDTTWDVTLAPRLRAVAPAGDWSGPALGFDVVAGATPQESVAVLTLHPRIENTGFVARRLVRAEPLLEHGLALGLAYVNAVSLVRAVAP
jgi:hypothetical protein